MHRPLSIVAALLFTTALAGCDNPADTKPKAQVSDAPAASAKPNTAAAASAVVAAGTAAAGVKETLAIAADGSKVEFVGSKLTGRHEGHFTKLSGSIELVDGAVEKSKVSMTIDTDSVTTDADKLTGHLKSPDFFDTAKFPKATFESTAIRVGGAAGATHTMAGNLDLHGVKKVISFPATITVAADSVSATAEFVINRKDFGIVYAGKADDLIRDDVVLKLSLKAPRVKK